MVRDGAAAHLTMRSNREKMHEQGPRRTDEAQQGLCRLRAELRRQTLRRNPGAGFLLHQSRQEPGRPRGVPEADRDPGEDQGPEGARTSRFASSATSPSSMRRPATSMRMAGPRTAATPIAGLGRTASGSRCRRMSRGSMSSRRTPGPDTAESIRDIVTADDLRNNEGLWLMGWTAPYGISVPE